MEQIIGVKAKIYRSSPLGTYPNLRDVARVNAEVNIDLPKSQGLHCRGLGKTKANYIVDGEVQNSQNILPINPFYSLWQAGITVLASDDDHQFALFDRRSGLLAFWVTKCRF